VQLSHDFVDELNAEEPDERLVSNYDPKDSASAIVFAYGPEYRSFAVFKNIAIDNHSTQRWSALTGLFYTLLIGALFLWAFPLVRRLYALRTAATRISQGDLGARIEPSRFSYIGEIEADFNRMANQIQNLVADNRLLSSAVSHDLRTPLTRIGTGVALLVQENGLPETGRVAGIRRDLSYMEDLVHAMLELSQIDAQDIAANFETVDLVAIVRQCLTVSTEEKEIRLVCTETPLCVAGNEFYLRRVVYNLLENAGRYAAYIIEVNIVREGHNVRLSVHDDGPGVPVECQQRILKPFERDKSHLDNTDGEADGFGLGLTFVEKITRYHNGSVSVGRSSSLGGASFTVTLPGV
jgi:two-component system OmpR family sensor kinase